MQEDQEAVLTIGNVGYLPGANIVEIILTETPPPDGLTAGVLLVPITSDGGIVFANDAKKGIALPSGEIASGRDGISAMERILIEAIGSKSVEDVRIGHLRMTSKGPPEAGWDMPHPVAYRDIVACRVAKPRNESISTIVFSSEDVEHLDGAVGESARHLRKAALEALGQEEQRAAA